jgi:hypothetical protein
MNGNIELVKLAVNLGFSGMLLLVVWKLIDKWAGRFLDVQTAQAKAMGDLAAAVKESQGEQREVLLAVRVLAAKMDEQKGWVKELVESRG